MTWAIILRGHGGPAPSWPVLATEGSPKLSSIKDITDVYMCLEQICMHQSGVGLVQHRNHLGRNNIGINKFTVVDKVMRWGIEENSSDLATWKEACGVVPIRNNTTNSEPKGKKTVLEANELIMERRVIWITNCMFCVLTLMTQVQILSVHVQYS